MLENLNINPLQDASGAAIQNITAEDFISGSTSAAPFSADTIADATPPPPTDGAAAEPPPVAPLPDAEPIHTAEPIDEKAAIDGVHRFVAIRDIVVSMAFAFYVKDFNKFTNFMLTKEQKENLVIVYSKYPELFARTPKYLDLIVAEGMVLFATFKAAQNFKKAQQLAQQATQPPPYYQQQQQYTPPPQQAPPPPPMAVAAVNTLPVIDGRKYWFIDENGFFEYEPLKRNYVKKADRIKADPAQHYEILAATNGKENIDRIFNLS